MDSQKKISVDVIVAAAQCLRKAFLLLSTDEHGTTHEYVRMLEHRRTTNREKHVQAVRENNPRVRAYDVHGQKSRDAVFIDSHLIYEDLEAHCDILARVEGNRPSGIRTYEPTIVVGTYSINNAQRLELSHVGYVLGKLQGRFPSTGNIIGMDDKVHKVDLEAGYTSLSTSIDVVRQWTVASSTEPPPVILNDHCPYCQFQASCKAIAEQNDDISLLDRATPKVIRQYHDKGIFTVRQLSYLFRPRKNRKRVKKHHIVHRLELQALAIRTNKIYLQETPAIARQQVELFLDIEGIPDQHFYYLIGLLICKEDTASFHSFWADTSNDEERIWRQFLETIAAHPEAPLYHYGSYEPRAIATLAARYQTQYEDIRARLVNVNEYIYGKIYFPTRSNRLKDIGGFIGAHWSSPNASGLQSLAWRYLWEETGTSTYKQALTAYNAEDCNALKLLTDEISRISTTANSASTIDFVDQPKQYATQTGEEIHDQFKQILRSAHANYDKNKIDLRAKNTSASDEERKRGGKKGHQGYTRVVPRARKVIQVPPRLTCPRCNEVPLRASEKTAETTVIDIVFTKDGCKKTITKYIWTLGCCRKCGHYYSPEEMSKKGKSQVFGHGLQAWVIYQRLVLRLSYRLITQAIEDQFRETLSEGSIVVFINRFAEYYAETEEIIRKRVLQSPFVHADETKLISRATTNMSGYLLMGIMCFSN